MGISPDHCVVLDHPELQDNPKKWWDEKLVEEIIAPYIKRWEADLVSAYTTHDMTLFPNIDLQIMTFDEGGISGHINHRAVSAGIK